MTVYRLMDGVAGRPGGGTGTPLPALTGYTGNYEAGLLFNVTSQAWFTGYWWYVPAGGDTGAVKFALWQIVAGTPGGVLVPGSVITSGTLTASSWNYTALPVPLMLSQLAPYEAAVGYVAAHGFPDTTHQFGATDPYSTGITNGPLTAYKSGDPAANSFPQMPFTTAASDPSVTRPSSNNLDDLLWLDVQVQDTAPVGFSSYRTFPNMPRTWPIVTNDTDVTGYTLGMQFSVSKPCSLQKIWHYSPTADMGTAAVDLPTRCAIWSVASQTVLSGTDNAAPAWKKPDGTAAVAGDGWIYCDYSAAGVTLAPSTQYKVSTFHAGGTGAFWFGAASSVFGTGNLYQNGFTQGPLIVPGNSGATPGQQSWNVATWAYPNTSTNPEADFIDVEVSPVASGSGLLMAVFP